MRTLLPMTLFVLLATATALADSPSDALRADGVDEAVVAEAEALVAHYRALADVIEAAGEGTCPQLATALEAFVAERGEALRATAARLERLDPATGARIEAAWAEELEVTTQRMLGPLAVCVADTRVVEAMESLSTAPPTSPMDEPDTDLDVE